MCRKIRPDKSVTANHSDDLLHCVLTFYFQKSRAANDEEWFWPSCLYRLSEVTWICQHTRNLGNGQTDPFSVEHNWTRHDVYMVTFGTVYYTPPEILSWKFNTFIIWALCTQSWTHQTTAAAQPAVRKRDVCDFTAFFQHHQKGCQSPPKTLHELCRPQITTTSRLGAYELWLNGFIGRQGGQATWTDVKIVPGWKIELGQ